MRQRLAHKMETPLSCHRPHPRTLPDRPLDRGLALLVLLWASPQFPMLVRVARTRTPSSPAPIKVDPNVSLASLMGMGRKEKGSLSWLRAALHEACSPTRSSIPILSVPWRVPTRRPRGISSGSMVLRPCTPAQQPWRPTSIVIVSSWLTSETRARCWVEQVTRPVRCLQEAAPSARSSSPAIRGHVGQTKDAALLRLVELSSKVPSQCVNQWEGRLALCVLDLSEFGIGVAAMDLA